MKKILVVEDNKRLADHIERSLAGENRDIKIKNNRDDAINELENWFPDVVVLDLEIFKNSNETATADKEYGVAVAKNAEQINNNTQGANIHIVFLTANLQESHVKRLISNSNLIRGVVDKGDTDHLEQIIEKVDAVLKHPTKKEESIAYKDFRPEILDSLKDINSHFYEMITTIIGSFKRKDYTGCITGCWSFVKCLHDEMTFTVDKGKEELMRRFNAYNKESKEKTGGNTWADNFEKLIGKGLRDLDKDYAMCIRNIRNDIAHSGEGGSMRYVPTMDDAASVMRLLVPLINSYVQFSKGRK